MAPGCGVKMNDDPQSLRVLLVDDQPENLIALEAALAPLGYTLITAESGKQALKCLLEQEVAAIILDVAMPDMDGFETATLIRARQCNQTTPIIFLTALYCDETAQTRGYAVGGSDYLMKPIDLALVRAKVRTFAELFAQTRRVQAQALAMRDHFLAVAAHELKTPLTAILGYGQLLQRRTRTAEAFTQRDSKLVDILVDQVERLNRLASLLLDATHLHEMRVHKQPLDLCALVQRVIRLVEGIAAKHYTFDCQTAAERMMVLGDELRLEQVFYNLIQNAIKYSPGGGLVRIGVDQHDPWACVSITDHGIGVPIIAHEAIFEQFYRASNAIDENISGLGLGLTIVKELVALHGGTIELTSNEGQGSTFTVCLPSADRIALGADEETPSG